jgi:uncharacterized membrane protein (UPF0127 family)
MRLVRVVNRTQDVVLAERAELATSMWERFVGLMGRGDVPAGAGLVLQPGGGIHTWFMRIPIDVVHVGNDGAVTHVLHAIKPWRFGPLFVGRKMAVELPAGGASSTQSGDQVELEPLAIGP